MSSDDDANTDAETKWLGQYRIQSRGDSGRAITIPQAVAPEMAESVVVCCCGGENDASHLKLSLGHPVESPTEDGGKYIGNRSVIATGEGSRVGIPHKCNETRYRAGSQVLIAAVYCEEELAHLKLYPQQAVGQAISSVAGD